MSITNFSLEKGKVGMKLVDFQQISWRRVLPLLA